MQAHITTYSRTEFSHLQHPSALCRAVPRFQPFPHSPSTPHRLTEHLAHVNISVHGVSVATKSLTQWSILSAIQGLNCPACLFISSTAAVVAVSASSRPQPSTTVTNPPLDLQRDFLRLRNRNTRLRDLLSLRCAFLALLISSEPQIPALRSPPLGSLVWESSDDGGG